MVFTVRSVIVLLLLCAVTPVSATPKIVKWMRKRAGPVWPENWWGTKGKDLPAGRPATLPSFITAPTPSPTPIPSPSPGASPSPKARPTIPPLPETFFLGAARVSASFETSREDPYLDVTPDFDGQGLTLGMFGWNIGQRSLQPLVMEVGQEIVRAKMRHYARDFWDACNPEKITHGLGIVRSWQVNCGSNSARFRPEHVSVVKELQALLGSEEMRVAQRTNARARANTAWRLAVDWARRDHPKNPSPTIREFAVFLDTVVQNGGLAGLTYDDTVKWYREHPDVLPSQVASEYLLKVVKPQHQPVSAHANAEIWGKEFPVQYERLLLLSFMRAERSYGDKGLAKAVVLCRRGTILANKGVVNDQRWTFTELEETKKIAGPVTSPRDRAYAF